MRDLGGSLFPRLVATMLLHLGDLEPGSRVADAAHLAPAPDPETGTGTGTGASSYPPL